MTNFAHYGTGVFEGIPPEIGTKKKNSFTCIV